MWNISLFITLIVNYIPNHDLVEFLDFINKYNKSYESHYEFNSAFFNFNENKEMIYCQNYNVENNIVNETNLSYVSRKPYHLKYNINEFADLSTYEFDNMFKGLIINNTKTSSCQEYTSYSNSVNETLDWRELGVVTPIKNQGQCGSCWSFSATGAMESAWAIYSGELLSLSEQQLIDCSIKYGDLACHGGLMDNAFDYAIDNGMCSEDAEPYVAAYSKCNECESVAKFSYCVDVTKGNELHLKEAVFDTPISVAINANSRTFQFYSSGIITPEDCTNELDHGVLLIGYGEEEGKKYWLLKNSWGETWGEKGYFRLERTDSEYTNGTCGIALQPSFPVVV